MSADHLHFQKIEKLYRLRESNPINFTRLTGIAKASLEGARDLSEIQERARLFPGRAAPESVDHTAQTVLALRDGVLLRLHNLSDTAHIPQEVSNFLDSLIKLGKAKADEAQTQEWERLHQSIQNDSDRKNIPLAKRTKNSPEAKLSKLIKAKPEQVRELAQYLDQEIQKKLPLKKEDAILELQRRVSSFQPPNAHPHLINKTYTAITNVLKQVLNQQLTRNFSLPRLELQNELENALSQVKEKCTKEMIRQGLEIQEGPDPWHRSGALSNGSHSLKPGPSGKRRSAE